MRPRFFIDHGMIHDGTTGAHVTTEPDSVFQDGIDKCCALLNALHEEAENYRALRNCARMRVMGYAGNIREGDTHSKNPPGHIHMGMEFWSHHEAPTEERSLEIFDRFVAILRTNGPTKDDAHG